MANNLRVIGYFTDATGKHLPGLAESFNISVGLAGTEPRPTDAAIQTAMSSNLKGGATKFVCTHYAVLDKQHQ